MSGDQTASSFGDPNAQPPTPKQTPTASTFPSPVFQTPDNRDHTADSSGWTPRYAEEYSVFNSTPGNLRPRRTSSVGGFTPFAEHSAVFAGQKRHLDVVGFAQEIAAHANHFTGDPSIPLPPVEPSRRLPSSPNPLSGSGDFSADESEGAGDRTGASRPLKKARRESVRKESQGQTATPPSSGPRERRLAPKPLASKMQDDETYGETDFSAGQMQDMSFMTPTSAMFNYPMSAPATAPPNFWDPAGSFINMDLDFAPGNILQTPTPSHRHDQSYDWANDGRALQESHMPAATPKENAPPVRRERPLAPKVAGLDASAAVETNTNSASMSFGTSGDDPFAILGTAVNPGLVFGGSDLSGLKIEGFQQVERSGSRASELSRAGSSNNDGAAANALRRSMVARDSLPRGQLDRVAASSPIKPNPRPALNRSFSEARGKNTLSRKSLTSLAPIGRPVSGSGSGAPRAPSSRIQGRVSPLKIHQRQASTGSSGSRGVQKPLPSVAFHIDDSGRAHAETIFANAGSPPSLGQSQRISRELSQPEVAWESSSEELSSEDEEPILLPSRNTSFALPDAKQATSVFLKSKHSSKISMSERSSTSNGDSLRLAPQDNDSEAETVTNEEVDATSELRRVMSSRNKRLSHPGSAQRSQRPLSGSFGGGYRGPAATPKSMSYSSSQLPSSRRKEQAIRCVCNRAEADIGDGFLVQCESCEKWLHGICVNYSKQVQPTGIYICAFCANTPNMRRGRMRDNGRVSAIGPGAGSSPLAHKSFKSFR